MKRSERVKHVLMSELADVADDCRVLLSSGVDSLSVLLALLELGKKPIAMSFTLDGRMSTDFSLARRNAKVYGVPFEPVFLPTGMETLRADVRHLLRRGAKSKTDIECSWPVWRALKDLGPVDVAMGHCADGHFGLSKKAMIHYRKDVALLEAYREKLFTNPGYAQLPLLRALLPGDRLFAPYKSDAMRDVFRNADWFEINIPQQKQTIRDALPISRHAKVKRHTNLQLGDSGIAKLFEGLKAPGEKSVRSTYNRMAKEVRADGNLAQ